MRAGVIATAVPVVAQLYGGAVEECGYFQDPDYEGGDGPLGLGRVVLGPVFGNGRP